MSPSCAPSACVDEPNLTTKSDLTGLSGRPCETITELPSIWCDYSEPNNGKTPMEACCICGGRDHLSVAPSLLPLQNPSMSPSVSIYPSTVLSEAPSAKCVDEPSWAWDTQKNFDLPLVFVM